MRFWFFLWYQKVVTSPKEARSRYAWIMTGHMVSISNVCLSVCLHTCSRSNNTQKPISWMKLQNGIHPLDVLKTGPLNEPFDVAAAGAARGSNAVTSSAVHTLWFTIMTTSVRLTTAQFQRHGEIRICCLPNASVKPRRCSINPSMQGMSFWRSSK
jgi:hypothetical protein